MIRYIKIFVFMAAGTALLCLYSCTKEKPVVPEPSYTVGTLELLNSYDINITEPSGLSYGPENNTFLIVSDNTNNVYETDLTGNVIRELGFVGSDLEGVTYNPIDDIVAVTDEQEREVIFIDYQSGVELSRHSINIDASTDNKGLEGISFNRNNSAYYIVNEGEPGELVVWNTKFGIISETIMSFADDYSSVFVDNNNSFVWFLSDESRALYKCDYNIDVMEVFDLDISKYEGLVVDTEINRVFMVNDKTATLEIFTIVNN